MVFVMDEESFSGSIEDQGFALSLVSDRWMVGFGRGLRIRFVAE